MDRPNEVHIDLSSDGIHREKMISLGGLTAGIAHELNNPIGYIASNINSLNKYIQSMHELIQEAQELIPQEHQEAWIALQKKKHWEFIKNDVVNLVKETTDGAEHLKAVVADLKTLGRSSLSPEYVSLDACVRSALNVMTHQLKNKIQVDCHYAECQPLLLIRPQIIQSITNLIHNAIQAMGPNGGRIVINTIQKDADAVLTIEDNGPGIADDLMESIFDPYFTTKDSQQGCGLGLSIVREIMDQHHGSIQCDRSPLLNGARFTLQFFGGVS